MAFPGHFKSAFPGSRARTPNCYSALLALLFDNSQSYGDYGRYRDRVIRQLCGSPCLNHLFVLHCEELLMTLAFITREQVMFEQRVEGLRHAWISCPLWQTVYIVDYREDRKEEHYLSEALGASLRRP